MWSVREAYKSREATQRKMESKSQDFIRCDDVTMGSMWWCVSSGILSISVSVCVRDELHAFSLSLSFFLSRTHSHKRAASEGVAGMECGCRHKAFTAHHTVTTKQKMLMNCQMLCSIKTQINGSRERSKFKDLALIMSNDIGKRKLNDFPNITWKIVQFFSLLHSPRLV